MTQHKTTPVFQIIAVLGLLLSILALGLAWTAYSGSDADMSTAEMRQSIEQQTNEAKAELAMLEAKTRLALVRAELMTEEGRASAEAELRAIRMDLAEYMSQTEQAAKRSWSSLEMQFEELEQNARVGAEVTLEELREQMRALEMELSVER